MSFLDYDEDYFFTRDELNEFGFEIVDQINDTYRRAYDEGMIDTPVVADLGGIYMEDPNTISIEVVTDDGYAVEHIFKVDMRRIRSPRDLYKYSAPVVTALSNQLHQAIFD